MKRIGSQAFTFSGIWIADYAPSKEKGERKERKARKAKGEKRMGNYEGKDKMKGGTYSEREIGNSEGVERGKWKKETRNWI